MARGRIIVSDITRDKRVNDLSCDTSRLAFTWLVTFADSAGRTHGDPALVKSMLFPRRIDVTADDVAVYLQEWHDSGLVIWYEADDDLWVQFPSFHKHQRGFDRRHEPGTSIPDPPATRVNDTNAGTWDVRTDHVQSTAEVKRSEVKRSEVMWGTRQPKTSDGAAVDPVADILEHKARRDEVGDQTGIAEAGDADQYFRYRNVAYAAYQELTGRTLNAAQREAIIDIVDASDFDASRWRRSVQSVVAAGVRDTNVSCMVDTYRAGGDYTELARKGKGNGATKHTAGTISGNRPRAAGGTADPADFL